MLAYFALGLLCCSLTLLRRREEQDEEEEDEDEEDGVHSKSKNPIQTIWGIKRNQNIFSSLPPCAQAEPLKPKWHPEESGSVNL